MQSHTQCYYHGCYFDKAFFSLAYSFIQMDTAAEMQYLLIYRIGYWSSRDNGKQVQRNGAIVYRIFNSDEKINKPWL